MPAALRPFTSYIAARPIHPPYAQRSYLDPSSTEFLWFRLRQAAEVPEVGMRLFTGTLAERRSRYRDFRAFLRQAKTYWDAGGRTVGSAAALPYYYGELQLAKAELLRTNPGQIQGAAIMHGLRKERSTTTSMRSDYLVVTPGVFPLLFEKRTGVPIPIGTRIRVMNLLSMIPEISMEMGEMSPTRRGTMPGYFAWAHDGSSAWSLVLTYREVSRATREHLDRKFLSRYEEVSMADFRNWREVFALSSRMYGTGIYLYQSKKTASITRPDGSSVPDPEAALSQLADAIGHHMSPPGNEMSDFLMTDTVGKTDPLLLPLSLVRYAAMFYLSSVVRYSPAALDPIAAGAQAYLMDSFVNELPDRILRDALDGIHDTRSFFQPGGYRL